LVVLVVVDQLRGDLLGRYDSLFTGGIRRLHDEGFRFTDATHFHAKTSTGVGHATLGTGVFPSRHGIVGNNWYERTSSGWRTVYCVEDTLSHILGHPALWGRSPANFLRSGLADWIQTVDSSAIVASISRKDRAAVGMAARARGHVYWIPENESEFLTSSYYAQGYPGWVERFNREVMPQIFGDSVWEQTIPDSWRSLTRPDTAEYEGDGERTYFPHSFFAEASDPGRPDALKRWAYRQIHPDLAVAAFARETIGMLELGTDDATDFLGISFSQADRIGHDYGPLSREQLEVLLHIDRALGELMSFLDERVGADRWVMALTADHGVLTVPEYMGDVGRRSSPEELRAVRAVFERHREANGDPAGIERALVADLEALPIVAQAVPLSELFGSGPPADSFQVLMRHSYHPTRWAWEYGSAGTGVIPRFLEGLYPSSDREGTGHGQPYYYDRHVPLIFIGQGISPGLSTAPVRTVDVAPTLADLAGIPVPDDLDGVPLFR
jgi:hypothetical protein